MKTKDFIKDMALYIIATVLLSMMILFVNSNIIIGAIFAIVSIALSSTFLYLYYKNKNKDNQKIASYNFFATFLTLVQTNHNCLTSYDASIKYLSGYQRNLSYEECLQQKGKCYNVYNYQNEFEKVIQLDSDNQALLSDYNPIIDDVESDIEKMNLKVKKQNKLLNVLFVSLIIFYMVLCMLILMFNPVKEYFNMKPMNIIYSILLAIIPPICIMILYLNERRN